MGLQVSIAKSQKYPPVFKNIFYRVSVETTHTLSLPVLGHALSLEAVYHRFFECSLHAAVVSARNNLPDNLKHYQL